MALSPEKHATARQRNRPKTLASDHEKDEADTMKFQYWLYVSMQKRRKQVSNVRLYPVQLPEQRFDGVIFQPSTKLTRD